MAIALATNADWLIRTSGLVNCTTGPSTTMFWVKLDAAGASYRTQWLQIDDPATYQDYIAWFSHVAATDVYGSGAIAGVAADSANAIRTSGQWMHLTLIRSAANVTFVLVNGKNLGSVVKDLTTATLAKEYLGNDTFGDGGQTFAYARQWDAVISNEQIPIEMQSPSAVQTANLWGDWPFTSDINDTSGNGRNWTQVGSGSFVAGPTFPANNSAANAIALSTNDSVTLDMNDGAYAWYSYTPVTDAEVVLGFWGFYDFTKVDDLQVAFYQGPTSAPVEWPNTDNPEGGSSVPYQIPLTFGTTIYARFSPLNIAATPFTSDINISTVEGPRETAPAGSIAVNDDLNGFPLALLNETTGVAIQFVDLVAGGSGVIMTDGLILLTDDDGGNYVCYLNTSDGYEQQWTLPFLHGASALNTKVCGTDGSTLFYIRTNNVAGTCKIDTVDRTGAVVSTFTLTNGVIAAAPDQTNTILYYTLAGTNAPIQRWNLITDSAMSDLIAGVVNYRSAVDLLVLADTSIIAGYIRSAPLDNIIKQISAAGAVLNTYTSFLSSGVTSTTLDHMASAIDDPVSFWAWFHNDTNAPYASTFYEITAATGAKTPVDAQQYEQGQYGGDFTTDPTNRFGHSNSCPFWINRVAIGPPTPTPSTNTTEYLIRRERWFPHLSQEQFRMFYSMLQIDLQAGNGLGNVDSTTQGFNPILELDWSDDGGWTWSNLHLIETGKRGQYSRRAIARMLGSSRDRVFRIAVSDPVQWAIVNAYMQLVKGTS